MRPSSFTPSIVVATRVRAKKGPVLLGAMLRAENFGSAAVAIPRSHAGGGAPPRSPARPLDSYWVVLRLGRGAGLGVSLGRRSRAGSKREPDSQRFHIAEFWSSPLFYWNCRGRSFGRGSSCAPLVPRVRASFELDVCSVNRYVYAEDAYCRISFYCLVRAVARLPLPPKPRHAFRERPQG